ncbi:putative helicase mug81 [Favolaschia claudopus]|uniref:Helicase mug81 n=1 Tax=Favolaschia claudopus TaxID=2862362 RepID=A0AAW0ECE7_9AGAR
MLSHFSSLVGSAASQESHTSADARALEEWARYKLADDIDIAEDDWNSVLDVYSSSVTEGPQTILDKLVTKFGAGPLLESLYSILSRSQDHDVSEEVAEAVGYEDMELVVDILKNRETLVKQLSELQQSVSDSTRSDPASLGLSQEDARRRMDEAFRKNAARPLFSGTAEDAPEVLPYIFTSSSMVQGNVLSQSGSKYMLPLGTVRQMHEDFEEVTVPPARPVPPRETERLVSVAELDPLAQGSFPGYASLNRIQSIVYPTAYGSNENMLGKTDVAMLTILRVLDQHRTAAAGNASIASTINKSSFKIIYVAPMKALASEIVRKFSKRLQWLSIQVRELTGDMQLTKAEIAQTQVIVTTPEKWDVVTRKPTGEGELASSLKLLIIDEVHLLNEDRGAVIETIVARTLRQVFSEVPALRPLLPSRLFYFDSSFRPVPLEQHFIGIKGKTGSQQSKKNLDRVTFQKVSDLVAQGHQVMVFVHARKETVKTALALREASLLEGNVDDFSCEDHPQWSFFRQQIGQSRNKEMKQLFDGGFGIHHAGMLRPDRNMMERMFEARAIKVLCCTATLAWGVNLPAHAVVIKGTQVYDSSKGAFVDLSVLDVLQVFGRAGRPGLETSGEGYICTTEDKLTHYLDAVTSQNPIESQFQRGIIDSLNAEISLGTVANIQDGVRWLGYTYLFVRMRKNPAIYGISRDTDDLQLGSKRYDLITAAAGKLADAGMIIFDRSSGDFTITDLGRIAAKYYIRYASIEIFNKEFRQKMSEADVLGMLSMSTEFDQIQVRESELKELKLLLDVVPCDVKGVTNISEAQGTNKPPRDNSKDPVNDFEVSSQGKVNILLQAVISRQPVEDFALVSDSAYAAQNGGRIVRALLEIAISRKWANVSAVLMGISKAIEKRMWPFDQPLKQFDLKADIFYGLERWADELSPAELAALGADELGQLVHLNKQHGQAILTAAKQFPSVRIAYKLRPLAPDVLKIAAQITPTFTWSSKVHGSAEPFWLWVEDHDGLNILHLSHLIFRPTTGVMNVDFIISIPHGQAPPSVTVRFVSDRWMGAEDEISIPLDTLLMPAVTHSHSPRLDLPFLSPSILRNPVVESRFVDRLHNFNSIQTQAFWTTINSNWHTLLCGPVGCGKSLLIQVLVWMTAMKTPDVWILIVTPRKSVASELLSELRSSPPSADVVVELNINQNALIRPRGRVIRIVTAPHLLHLVSQRDSKTPVLRGLDLVVCENLELLDPAYELAVSLLRHAVQTCPTRFVGASSSLSDPVDLGTWLGVDSSALLSFRPSDRDQSVTSTPHTFSIPHSASLFKAMAKPAHAAIQSDESAIVFVPSRGHCRSVAYDLITQCALEQETEKGYLSESISQERLEDYLVRLRDALLIDFVSRGIGFFHEGINKNDRNLILELYAEGIVRVLIVPHDSCWTLPVRAAVVVVMGTQYAHAEVEGGDRQLRDYELTKLVRMQGRAVRHSGAGHFHLFCQAEGKDTFIRFLNDGLPLESALVESSELRAWHSAHSSLTKQGLVDVLSFTFLARRIASNPAYYDCVSDCRDENLSRIVDDLVYAADATRGAAVEQVVEHRNQP